MFGYEVYPHNPVVMNFHGLSRRDLFYLDLQSQRVISIPSTRERNLLGRSLITFEMTLLFKAKRGPAKEGITS